MKQWKRDRFALLCAVLSIVGIVVIVIGSRSWLMMLLGIAIVVTGMYSLSRWQRSFESELDRQRAEHVEAMLEAMQNRRHDWFNVLQVLYGYIQLEKYDRLMDSIRQFEDKLENESQAAKVNIPELSWFLQRKAGEAGKLMLEIEAASNLELHRLSHAAQYEWKHAVIDAVQTFESCTKEDGQQLPLLTLQWDKRPEPQNEFICHIVFTNAGGAGQAEEAVEQWKQRWSRSSVLQVRTEIDPDQIWIELKSRFDA